MAYRKHISCKERMAIFERDQWLCWYCGQEIATGQLLIYIGREAVIDHKIPVAWHGTNARNNLVASCRACNAHKRDLSVEAYREKLLHKGQFTRVVFFGERHEKGFVFDWGYRGQ